MKTRIYLAVTLVLLTVTLTTITTHARLGRTWDRGAGTSNWADAANWNPDGVPTSADSVTFTDTGAGTVDLNNTSQPSVSNLQGIAFNNAVSGYTVQNGTISTSGVTNNSGAAVTNTISAQLFSGSLSVNSGTLVLSNTGNSISGSQSIAAGAKLDVTAPTSKSIGSVSLNGGTLLVRGGDLSGSSMTVTSANSVLDFQATTGSLGNVSFNSGTSLTVQGTATSATLGTLSGSGSVSLSNSVPLSINGVTGPTAFSKNGNSRLAINGSVGGTTPITVNNGTLGGTGTIVGAVSVASGGTVAPGNSVGTLSTGSFSINGSGGTVGIELDPTNIGAHGTSDNLNVTGGVTLTGGNLALSLLSTPTIGQQFQIITNDGSDAVTGTFSTVNGATIVGNSFVVGGYTFSLNYAGGSGNDVVLTVMETPSLVVTTTADTVANDGQTSLREAINYANRHANGAQPDEITFNIPVAQQSNGVWTIQLGSALPNISDNVTITGAGALLLTVRGEGAVNSYRIFTINSGVTATISGLTVTNGYAADSAGGGGILNSGTLALQNSIVSGNKAQSSGGGIENQGTLTVINSAISGNSSSTNTLFTRGGGICNEDTGTLTVTNSTISGNSNLNGNGGGGISNSGALTMTNSTVSGNSAQQDGGGIYDLGPVGTLTLTSVTITNNRARFNNNVDPSSDGGGIFITFGAAAPATPPLLRNTIVADNYLDAGTSTESDIQGSTVSSTSSYNLIGTGGSGGLTNGTNNNQVGVANPGLGALQDNGGATQTHALLAGSPAIDKGKNFAVDSGNNSILTDQRGLTRPVDLNDATYPNAAGGDGSDIGAYEAQTAPAYPQLSINDVAKAEGNSGTTTFTFTVTLDSPAPVVVTFNASTADGTATTANNDYVGFTNQPHSIPVGGTSTTVDVTVNGDTVQETNETFFVNITNATNATVADGQGQGTILNDDGAPAAGQIIISEFRLSGPGPAPTPSLADSQRDEFIELYNATDSDFIVADSSPLSVSTNGWALVSSDDLLTPKYIVPAGTRIPARGHFLITNGIDYTLSLYPSGNDGTSATVATADGSYNTNIPEGSGIALFRTTNPALFAAPSERLDAAGFTGSTFFEGTPLQPAGGITTPAEHSFVRKQTTGRPQDTDNNQNDFVLVSTTGGMLDGVAAQLGAPGPENLTSPVNRSAQIKSTLLDPAASLSASPNRVRDATPGTGATAAGTLELRRTFTNKTGADVARLRFRIVDITSGAGAAGTADVRALTSSTLSNVAIIGPNGACPANLCTVRGTTLEEPPTQVNGGGLNSTLSAGTISLAAPLAPGASVNVRFLLGVATSGSFRFFIIVEALPAVPASSSVSAPPTTTNLDDAKAAAPARSKSLAGSSKGAKGDQ